MKYDLCKNSLSLLSKQGKISLNTVDEISMPTATTEAPMQSNALVQTDDLKIMATAQPTDNCETRPNDETIPNDEVRSNTPESVELPQRDLELKVNADVLMTKSSSRTEEVKISALSNKEEPEVTANTSAFSAVSSFQKDPTSTIYQQSKSLHHPFLPTYNQSPVPNSFLIDSEAQKQAKETEAFYQGLECLSYAFHYNVYPIHSSYSPYSFLGNNGNHPFSPPQFSPYIMDALPPGTHPLFPSQLLPIHSMPTFPHPTLDQSYRSYYSGPSLSLQNQAQLTSRTYPEMGQPSTAVPSGFGQARPKDFYFESYTLAQRECLLRQEPGIRKSQQIKVQMSPKLGYSPTGSPSGPNATDSELQKTLDVGGTVWSSQDQVEDYNTKTPSDEDGSGQGSSTTNWER